jgi:hypothetical protein
MLRLKPYLLNERPDVFNTIVGSCIQFQDIEGRIIIEGPAR